MHKDYSAQMKLSEPFNPMTLAQPNTSTNYQMVRGLIESVNGGSFGFVSEGTMTRSISQSPQGPQEQIEDRRNFEGWKTL